MEIYREYSYEKARPRARPQGTPSKSDSEAISAGQREAAPGRNKSSDGWIGDSAHQATKSDHNPNKAGVVQAQNITHDPHGGFDSYKFAELLRTKQDKRIKYVISNRKIFGGPTSGTYGKNPWKWKAYRGKNPHDQHVHVSVADRASLYDDDAPWDIGLDVGLPDPTTPEKTLPLVRVGNKGFFVELVQTLLGNKGNEVDGDFGPVTRLSVIQFQRDHKLDDDGIVGPYTWRELLRPWAKEVKLITPDPYATLNEMARVAQNLGAQGTTEEIAAAFKIVVRISYPRSRCPNRRSPSRVRGPSPSCRRNRPTTARLSAVSTRRIPMTRKCRPRSGRTTPAH